METKGKEKEIDTKIRVVVRCRPFVAEESRSRKCLQMSNDLVVIGDKKFSFEQVFNEESRQEEVYESCVKSLVEGCFQGFNGTVFAYGQTGSGKTYSIMGNNLGSEEDESEVGIIPRALHHMFDTLNQHLLDGKTMASIRVSMIEIYNDECRDLIHPEIPTRDIMIREDKHGRIFFTGAREEIVSNAKTAIQFLQQGALNRTTAETLMNQSSSRSHAIFTVSLEMIEYTKEGEAAVEDGSFIHAKLHLVDLAGSERAKRTGAVGTRFKESVGINQGLLSLGKVIRALTSNPITHVPYRESKLTRFLQDSLGGNSRTVLLACISPSEFNLHETLNTLHYAQRAKFIQNKISANISHGIISSDLQEDLESSLVISLRAEIVRMQKEMSEMVNIQSTNLPHRNLVHNDGNKQEEYDYENISLQRNSSTNNLTTNGMMNFKMVHKHYLSLKQVLFTLNDILSPTQTITERIIDDFEMNQKEKSASSSLPTTANTPRYPPDYKLATACQLATETIMKVIEQINSDPSHQLFSAQQFAQHQQTQQLFRSSLDKESFQKLVQHDPSNNNQQNKEELEKDLLIEQLTKQLEDCQEDLKRDEEIFSEKIKELKKYRKQVKELDTENKNIKKNYVNLKKNLQKLNKLTNSLRNSHDYQHSLQQQRKKNLNSIDSDQENDGNDLYQQDSLQVDPLSTSSTGMKKPLSTRGDGGSSSIGLSTARAERREGFNRANNNNNHHEHMTINQLTGANNNNNTSEQDDLNISMAVALTEPDISQLIEDIELLSKEKEELFYLSQQHEEKIEELIKEKSNLQNYEKENIELLKSFSNLQKEYQFLQTKLEEKEEIIQKTLLETTAASNPRPSSSSSSSKPLSLQEKEEELRKLIHNEYLSKFQLLNSLLEKKEKEISDYKSLQKNTEKENSFLMNEKSKLEKQFQELKEKLQQQQQQQKESVIDDQERKRRGGGDEEDEDYLEYSMNTQFSIHLSFDECISFLEKEMNEILEIGNIQLEITKLSQQLNMIEKETIDLQNEEKELLSLYENYQSIHKNYGMIDDKIKNLKLKKTNVKNKILKLKTSFEEEQKKKRSTTTMDNQPNNPRDLYENNEDYTEMKTNMEIMKKELSEIDFQIQSYQSYQSEMKERHQEIVSQFFSIVRSHSSNNNKDDNGEEDPEEKKDHHKDLIEEMDFENKLSEIREDLETYETEKEIISNRLLIEKQSLLNSFAKFQQKKKNKINNNNQNKKKTMEEEKDDDIEDSSNAIGMNTRTSFDKSLNYLLMKMKEFCFQKFPHLLSSSSNKKTTTPTTTTATTHELLLLEDYLLKLLFQFILQLKLSSKNIDNQQKQTKELLDTKCNEYDQLIILFTKLKNEFHETKQSMRKEHEEKIMFLLQQIKILESKYSSSSSSRPSTASGMMLPAPPGGSGPLASQQQMGLPPPSTPYQSSSTQQQQQQHHLLMNRLNEMERKQFEEFLMEFSSSHHHSHHPPSHNNNNPRPTSAAPGDTAGMGSSSLFMNYEIFKRYISEKERRELLEKKNVELLKELKSVRSLPSSK